MQPEQVMGSAARLGSSLEAPAALAAYLRVEAEQLEVDQRVHDLLRAIAVELLGEEPGLTRPQGAPVVGMARALLSQSAELVAEPGRPGGWATDDDAQLQGIGRMSAPIAGVIAGASADLDGLADALRVPGAAVLDVGTGTGWLVPAVVAAAVAALRPGGWLLPGTFAGPPDPLSKLLVDLRTVRAGGHPWDGADLVDEIAGHGLQGAHEVPRTWAAPVRLYAARRAP